MTLDAAPATRIRLRYRGTCRRCGRAVEAGQFALYDRAAKAVTCTDCADHTKSAVPEVVEPGAGRHRQPGQPSGPAEPPDPGTAGGSARREYERRSVNYERRTRQAHPHLGGLLLAVTDEPSHISSWAKGAPGEVTVGAHLDALADRGVRALHDRRMPHSRANIDHIAVASGGVWVIDAKRYQGQRPHLKVTGGFLSARTETLIVGTRNCSTQLDGMDRQLDAVRTALGEYPDDVPVRGVLCFVDADWPLFGGAFTARGVHVLWPGKLADLIAGGSGLEPDGVAELTALLAQQLVPA